MKQAHEILYEDFGLNGTNKAEGKSVIVIAGSIEKALRKFRSSLPKSLVYEIVAVEVSEFKVIL